MAPLVLGSILLGRVATIIGCTLLAILALKEFARATGLYRDWWMTGSVYLAAVAIAVVSLVSDPFSGKPGWFGLFTGIPVYAIALILMVPILRNRTQGQLQMISLAIVGFVYIGWMFGHLGFLANSDHAYGYLLYLLFAVELNDVAAFIFGKLFGRHKLCCQVSPGKTREGLYAALVGGLAAGMGYGALRGFTGVDFAQFLVLCLVTVLMSVVGDMLESLIKRSAGVKDSGSVLPGHGGMLDRIDSLTAAGPVFFTGVRLLGA